jgi:hypothetical protein
MKMDQTSSKNPKNPKKKKKKKKKAASVSKTLHERLNAGVGKRETKSEGMGDVDPVLPF